MARETWLERRGDLSIGNVVSNAFGKGLSGVLAAYRDQSSVERAMAALERQKVEIVTAEEMSLAEANWLAERIGRDGKISPNEQALLDFLVANSPQVAPELDAMMRRLRSAA